MDIGRSLRAALAKFTGAMVVDDKAVKELCKEIQRILISSDVNVRLVFELTKKIEKKALDSNVLRGLNPREHVVKIVYDELVALMGPVHSPVLKPHKILLLGLYGSGKTTTAGKLANFYKSRGLSVALICCDVDRPAAFEQLEQIAKTAGAKFYGIKNEKDVKKILDYSLAACKEDIIIVDSAGRSALEEDLIEQLKKITEYFLPDEKFLVISADLGQIAGKQTEEFHKAIGITGVIITKLDGSGKGGAAISAVAASNSKVVFIGTGEKLDAFEPFNPTKFIGRLLGFPDLEALLEKIKKISEESKKPLEEPEKLTLDVFFEQLKAAKKLGPLSSVFSMLGAADMPQELIKVSEEKIKKYEAILSSMTKKERANASLLKKEHSRISRIARGAGVSEKEVQELLSHFEKVEKMYSQFKHNRGFRKKLEKLLKSQNFDFKF
jgi:signal recognition particle subunit SRP54